MKGEQAMPHTTPSLGRPSYPLSRRARIPSTPYTWALLTRAQRQGALHLAAAHDQNMRRARRRTVLLTVGCVLLLVALTVLILSMTTATTWGPPFVP